MRKSDFQFQNPTLVSLQFSINESFINTGEIAMEVKSEIKVARNEKDAKVRLVLQIGEDNKELPFSINIIMESLFQWSDEIDDLDEFFKINATALLISYARPIISMITGMSKCSPYYLPFIDFS